MSYFQFVGNTVFNIEICKTLVKFHTKFPQNLASFRQSIPCLWVDGFSYSSIDFGGVLEMSTNETNMVPYRFHFGLVL